MLIRTLASLSCILGFGLAAGAGDGKADSNDKSCQHLGTLSCGNIKIYTDAELNDPEFLKVRDLDPRQVDFSSLDDDAVNITQLVRRGDLDHLHGPDLQSKVEELLKSLGKRDVADAFHLLTRAGDKVPEGTYEICKDTSASDAQNTLPAHIRKGVSMRYKTSPYPDGVDLFDCTDWSDCNNFKFDKNGQRSPNKDYIREHVLERQMLQQFFRQEIEGKGLAVPIDGYQDFCHMMRDYWYASDAKEQSEKPETFVNAVPAWNFVGAAWPNKDQGAEMAWVESQVNGMKARVFKEGTVVQDIESSRKWFTGDRVNDPKKVIEDLTALKESVRVAIFVTKYMDHPDIQKIYKTQAERVAVALGQAEDTLVQNWSTHPTRKPYKKQNLDAMFRNWMKKYTTEASEKLETYINLAEGFLNNQVVNAKDQKLSANEKKLVSVMEETVKETRKLAKFKNPF